MRKIEYKTSVFRELRRLDRRVATRIIDKIEQELTADDLRPIALTGPFEGLYKFRVGDYRVIYSFSASSIAIVRIAHRREVYR